VPLTFGSDDCRRSPSAASLSTSSPQSISSSTTIAPFGAPIH
jgi:hypothetical protein